MKCDNIGGCRSIESYVDKKLATLNRGDRSFAGLFELMFSEEEAVLYERSRGYKILYTTYGEARRNALRRAAALKKRLPEAERDAVIGIHMENSEEWIECFWAVLAAGFRPLLMNLRLDPELLEKALADCGAAAVIADKGEFSLPTILQDELAGGEEELSGRDFGSEVLVMSTGTSSNLKICGYGGEQFACLVNDSAYIVRHCRPIKTHYNGKIKQLTFLPFYHVFGLIAMYIWFGFFSRTFVHLADMEPQTILNTIRRHEVTHIFAVPLFWERIYDQAQRSIRERGDKTWAKYQKGLRLGDRLEAIPSLARLFRKLAFKEVRTQMFGESVKFMITGGSPIRPEALAFFNNIGYHLANGYGMTEIGITSVELSSSAARRSSASVGQPLPSLQYRLGEQGELYVRGGSLARSIRMGGELSLREDDWFCTGDLARRDKDGWFILGRQDDLLLLANGEMINPNLVEPSLRLPGLEEVCLIDAAGEGTAAPVLLASVKRSCGRKQLEQLREALLEELRRQKLETAVRGIEFVPGSLLGENEFKLNRAALGRKYRSGTLQTVTPESAAAAEPRSELEKQVAAMMAAVLNREAGRIGLDSDFFLDEGGTSLDYFALLSGLKDSFSLPFAEEDAQRFHTARGICEYIESFNADGN